MPGSLTTLARISHRFLETGFEGTAISTAVPLGSMRDGKSACGRSLMTMARFSAPVPRENKALADAIRHTSACAYLFQPGPDRWAFL